MEMAELEKTEKIRIEEHVGRTYARTYVRTQARMHASEKEPAERKASFFISFHERDGQRPLWRIPL